MTPLQFIFLLWLFWGTLSLAALVFVIGRPKVWAAWIDKENDYWVARGRFSPGFAEKIKKLEKGLAMKLLLGANVLLSVAIIYMLFHFTNPRPFRAMIPPPSAPHHLPPH
jgi:hypothetical protein